MLEYKVAIYYFFFKYCNRTAFSELKYIHTTNTVCLGRRRLSFNQQICQMSIPLIDDRYFKNPILENSYFS